MKNCLQCNKKLTHVEGRKQKSFCNVNCRNKYFYHKRKVLVEQAMKLNGIATEKMIADSVKPITEQTETQKQIEAAETEIKGLPDIGLGKTRKRFLQSKIAVLKKQL